MHARCQRPRLTAFAGASPPLHLAARARPQEAARRPSSSGLHRCVTDAHLRSIGRLTTLTCLRLNHVAAVTGPGLAALASLTGLTCLGLRDALNACAVQAEHLMVGVGTWIE
jgi:hypothetical protein